MRWPPPTPVLPPSPETDTTAGRLLAVTRADAGAANAPTRGSARGSAAGGPGHFPAATCTDADTANAPAGSSVHGSAVGEARPEASAGGRPHPQCHHQTCNSRKPTSLSSWSTSPPSSHRGSWPLILPDLDLISNACSFCSLHTFIAFFVITKLMEYRFLHRSDLIFPFGSA